MYVWTRACVRGTPPKTPYFGVFDDRGKKVFLRGRKTWRYGERRSSILVRHLVNPPSWKDLSRFDYQELLEIFTKFQLHDMLTVVLLVKRCWSGERGTGILQLGRCVFTCLTYARHRIGTGDTPVRKGGHCPCPSSPQFKRQDEQAIEYGNYCTEKEQGAQNSCLSSSWVGEEREGYPEEGPFNWGLMDKAELS